MSNRFDNYNINDLQRLVETQKRRIYRLLDDVNEARDIAKQLLFELRAHTETPATHVSFYWLRDDTPAINSKEVSDG